MILKDSEGWGAVRIHRELEGRYGSGVVSQRAVSKWIAASGRKDQRGEPQAWRKWQPDLWQQDAGYLLRLDLVSRGLFGRGLYEEEARWATRLELALQGLSVFAQWAVIEEYARRHINSETPATDDLDLLLATRPWRDEGLLERTVRRSGNGGYPTIRALSISHDLAEPLNEFLMVTEPAILTVFPPRMSKALLRRVERRFVALRIVLHISSHLHQPLMVHPDPEAETKHLRASHHYGKTFSIRAGTTESTQMETRPDDAESLLLDVFESLDAERSRSNDE